MANTKYDPETGRLNPNYIEPMTSIQDTDTYGFGDGTTGGSNTGYDLGNTNDGGLFGSLGAKNGMDGLMGIGQLGLGLFNFLENKKFNKARIKGLNENIASSQYARGAHKNFIEQTRQAFGG